MKRFLLVIGFSIIIISFINMLHFSGSALGNICGLLIGTWLFFDNILKLLGK